MLKRFSCTASSERSERNVHSEVTGCAGWTYEGTLEFKSQHLQDSRWLPELAAHTWHLLNKLLSATDYILNFPQRRHLHVLICLFSIARTPPPVAGVLAHKWRTHTLLVLRYLPRLTARLFVSTVKTDSKVWRSFYRFVIVLVWSFQERKEKKWNTAFPRSTFVITLVGKQHESLLCFKVFLQHRRQHALISPSSL